MRILVGITGGIAAYKTIALVRLLTEQGHSVKVIPTQNALRFVGATTLEAISHNTVDPDLYTDVESVKHIALAKEADLVIVAPATAAFLGRVAAGIADDLLTNVILATTAPVVIAPAMHTEMWTNPATRANAEILTKRGFRIMEPASGRLTGNDSGVGRLPEPREIVDFALGTGPLSGVHVVVTTGGTREPIDSVRFIGNHSSGKQGFAIARAASSLGARVTVVAANCEQAGPFNLVPVTSVAELDQALEVLDPSIDVLIMAAAVSDFRVENPATRKIRKADVGERLTLELIQNPDLLVKHGARIRAQRPSAVIVGFAAEEVSSSAELSEAGTEKLRRKNLDYIVANAINEGAVFGSEENQAVILDGSSAPLFVNEKKSVVAKLLMQTIANRIVANRA